jgi:uncharacterized repeat protein (TIGR04138 family)
MSDLRQDLAPVVARDARYPVDAYLFVLAALEHTKNMKRRLRAAAVTSTEGRRRQATRGKQHVTGQELCVGAKDLLLSQYGLLAPTVARTWGIRSTSDLGEIVYNMISAGDLEALPTDKRSDFDDVFDFEASLRDDFRFNDAEE